MSRRQWMSHGAALFVAIGGLAFSAIGRADDVQSADLEEVLVEGRRQVLVGEARSASEGVIGQDDLALRPLLRPGDILEAIPGLIVTQHSGSGKSNQMFLRGFNLDHGTDFATWIDGMPVNMRTHGHGQGYTDINFVIPELIRTIEFVKGPYHAELGDFSSAGGAHMRQFEQLDQTQLRLGLGENGFQRFLGMGGLDAGSGHFMAAVDAQAYDGPWTDIDEDVEKISGVLRYAGGQGDSSWNLTGMFYDNTWNSADQIPQRAVQQGLIDEFGSLDTTLGGDSSRNSISASWQASGINHATDISAYAIDYEMQLWSNFTYFLDNPEDGDQFEQLDKRRIYGANAHHRWKTDAGSGHIHHAIGADYRYDDIRDVGLFSTRQRQRLATTRRDSVDQSSVGAYYEFDWRPTHHWRIVAGLRADYYRFDVRSDNPLNSGDDSDTILSPKTNLIYTLNDQTEFYLSAGYGFHSNDARGTTIQIDPGSGERVDPVDPLVESRGAEIGFKTVWLDSWNSSLALWTLELDSELLFVGDAGTTEASRPSERWGIEFNNFWALNSVWALEADFAWTHARFSDNAPEGNHIPGALETVVTGSITGEWPNGWFGSFRVRYFDGAPLIEDDSVRSDGSTMANLSFGWKSDRWRLQLDVLNLFDSDDHDIDYFYASRLAAEPAGGVDDIHYHVFEPRQFRAYATLIF